METVNVQCSECHQPIGISKSDLGYHVECPLCQKVFLAPPAERGLAESLPSAEAPPAQGDATTILTSESKSSEDARPPAELEIPPVDLKLDVPSADERESIFGPPDTDSDDLFGESSAPEIEMPPQLEELAPPDMPLNILEAPTEIVREPGVRAPFDSGEHSKEIADSPLAEMNADAPSGVLPSSPAVTYATVQRVKYGSVVPVILLIFLIPYCLVTTAFIIWIVATKQAQHQDPLERMLEDPRRKAPGDGIQRIQHDLPIPKKLRTSLRRSLQIDKVEVRPLKVVLNQDGDLMLHLHLRNASDDLKFNPLPAKFTEYNRRRRGQMKPYVFLAEEGGGVRAYGGDLQWFQGPKEKQQPLLNAELSPDETMTAVLTTDPADRRRVQTLLTSKRSLLWRIQVRRGLELIAGRDRVITCVVGIEFGADEIETPQRSKKRTASLSRMRVHIL